MNSTEYLSNTEYDYDYFGKRLARHTNESEFHTQYIYDGKDVILEKYKEEGWSGYITSAVITRTLENTGNIISVRKNGSDLFYHCDPNGNVIMLTNISGNTNVTYIQDAFGNIIATTGSPGNNHHLHSQELDLSSSLYYYDLRWYTPVLGQFLSVYKENSIPADRYLH